MTYADPGVFDLPSDPGDICGLIPCQLLKARSIVDE